MVKRLPTMRETQVKSLVREDPLEEGMTTYSLFLAGKCHGQRSLAGYSPWGRKQLDMTERLIHTHKADHRPPYKRGRTRLYTQKRTR